VQPLSTLLSDAATGRSARGYQLFVAAATATHSGDNSYAPLIKPASAAVRLHITLAPQATYAATTLLQRQGPVELLTSIVGLLGILGVFRVLFKAAEGALAHCSSAGGGAAKRKLSTPGAAVGREAAFEQANPLGGGAGSGEAPPHAAAAAAPSQWHRCSDDQDTWYVAVEGGATAWTLPEGGVVVPEAAAAQLEVAAQEEDSPPAATWKKYKRGSAVWYKNTVTGETSVTRP
jgi:hypothetical protein